MHPKEGQHPDRSGATVIVARTIAVPASRRTRAKLPGRSFSRAPPRGIEAGEQEGVAILLGRRNLHMLLIMAEKRCDYLGSLWIRESEARRFESTVAPSNSQWAVSTYPITQLVQAHSSNTSDSGELSLGQRHGQPERWAITYFLLINTTTARSPSSTISSTTSPVAPW